MNQYYILVGTLLAISIAVERMTEIVKGIFPWLGTTNEDAKTERIRQSIIQGIAAFFGVTTCFILKETIATAVPGWSHWPSMIILGIFASGGSGIWNTFASYFLQLKNLKSSLAREELKKYKIE